MKFNNRSYFSFDNIYPFLALIILALFINYYHYDEELSRRELKIITSIILFCHFMK